MPVAHPGTPTGTALTSAASAHATGPATDAVPALVAGLERGLAGRTAAVVLYFASAAYDPADLAGPLTAAFPQAQVLGCSTAGEFTDAGTGTGGLSALALPEGVVLRCAAGLGELADGVAEGTDAAVAEVSRGLGEDLRDLDPADHLGLVLIDGVHGSEGAVNVRLGDAAPSLGVVGGSAGDDLAFSRTWVAVGERVSWHGVAFLVAQLGVPFRVVKSSALVPAGRTLRITRASERTVHELDGRPAVEAYAEAVGTTPDAVGRQHFMAHPLGLMLSDEPWVRSPQAVVGTSISFFAEVLEGVDVEVLKTTDLVAKTKAAVRAAVDELGGHAGGALMFNCILRRLEMDAEGSGDGFVAAFDGIPTGGFHTYGETWLGHVNQTLTGVVLG